MNEFEQEFDLQDQMRLTKEVSGDVSKMIWPAVREELLHLRPKNVFWLLVGWRGLRMAQKASGNIEQMFLDGKLVKISDEEGNA